MLQLESGPCLLQLEKALAQQRRPSAAKNKYFKKEKQKPKYILFNVKKKNSILLIDGPLMVREDKPCMQNSVGGPR